MLHEAYYFYYGSVIPIAEVSTRMYALNNLRKDIYCYIFDKGLQYRRVGNVRTTWRICIGKELLYMKNTLYEVNQQKSSLRMLDIDINKYKLDNKTRIKIETDLIDLGCTTAPHYWVIYSFFYDGVDEK